MCGASGTTSRHLAIASGKSGAREHPAKGMLHEIVCEHRRDFTDRGLRGQATRTINGGELTLPNGMKRHHDFLVPR